MLLGNSYVLSRATLRRPVLVRLRLGIGVHLRLLDARGARDFVGIASVSVSLAIVLLLALLIEMEVHGWTYRRASVDDRFEAGSARIAGGVVEMRAERGLNLWGRQ